MQRKRANKEPLDRYVDKMTDLAEKYFKPSTIPFPLYEPRIAEPTIFSWPECDEAMVLVDCIMKVLDGKKLSTIRLAGNVVEQFVLSQSEQGYFVYPSIPQSSKS